MSKSVNRLIVAVVGLCALAVLASGQSTIPSRSSFTDITLTSVNKVAVTAPATGATLTIADGKTLTANNSIALTGTDSTTMTFPTTSGNVATGVGLYKIARGSITLDGSNPSTAATGLTSVISCTASLNSTSAPGDDPSWDSLNINGTSLDLYAWKNTGGTDPTLVASTNNSAIFYWICIGT